eukprot:scaffold570_cov169-Alexandrium_tamarense.AAC.17
MFGAFHAHVDEENEVHSCPHATISPTFRALKARKQSSSLNEGAMFGEGTKKFDAMNDQSHPSKKVVAAAAAANLKDLVQEESVPSTEDTTSQYFHFQYNLALMTKNCEEAVFRNDNDKRKADVMDDQPLPSKKVAAAAAAANLKDLVQEESVPSTEDTTSQYFHFQYNLALMTKNYEEAGFRNDNDKRKADVMDDQPLPSKKVAAVKLYDLVQNFAYPAAIPSSATAQPSPSNFDMEMKVFLDDLDLLSTAAAADESGGEGADEGRANNPDPPIDNEGADDEIEEAFIEVVGYEQRPFLGFGQLPRQEEGAIHPEFLEMANYLVHAPVQFVGAGGVFNLIDDDLSADTSE